MPGRIEIPVGEEEAEQIKKFLKRLQDTLDMFEKLQFSPPPKDSPMAGDDGYMAGYPISLFVQGCMLACVENLASLRDLLVRSESGDSIQIRARAFGPYSVIRSALESAAQACWVLIPKSRWQRIARRWGIRCDELWAQGETVEDMARGANRKDSVTLPFSGVDEATIADSVQASREQVKKNKERIRQLVSDAPDALTWNMVKRATDGARWGNIFKDLEAENPKLEEFRIRSGWRICAALSHSKEWVRFSALDLHPLDSDHETSTTKYAMGVNYKNLVLYAQMSIYLLNYSIGLYELRCSSRNKN